MRILEAFLSNPTTMAIAAIALVVIGVCWFITQTQESKNADAERARNSGDSDSIWND